MIIGAHSIVYSKNADADRRFLREVLKLPGVDVGGGWLIFGLPPAEVAVHPSDENDVHEFYLMVDDIDAFVRDLASRNVPCAPVRNQGWGLLTELTLPGGGKFGVYEPRHARPKPMAVKAAPRAKAPRAKARKRAAAKKKAPRGKRTTR
jgi:hypothetical protein